MNRAYQLLALKAGIHLDIRPVFPIMDPVVPGD